MLHHLFVNTSLCISTKMAVVYEAAATALSDPRNLQSCFPTKCPGSVEIVMVLYFYCVFEQGLWFASIYITDYMVYLCDGQHTLQSSPVCVWMVAPFASSPCLLRLPDTAHGLLLRPGSDLMPHDSCIAVIWQPDSPISGRKFLDSTVSSQVCHLSLIETEGLC